MYMYIGVNTNGFTAIFILFDRRYCSVLPPSLCMTHITIYVYVS